MFADSDAEIVAATLAGRTERYGALVERHQRRLFLSLRQLTGSDRDAEEIAQDAFVRAWENLKQFDPAYPFFPWLSRIAVNLWHNRTRRVRREVPLDDGGRDDGTDGDAADEWRFADDAPSPDVLADAVDVRRRVWLAVDALPADAREIVVMRHALELSYEEICAATGLAMGTVKSRLSRARAVLAGALGDLEAAER
ncbi:MAG: RNA polymerase sigma factor [Ardenticatenales bacterium]|nr:RNA polymerase sigma factor [Ardenticatenales bacterium]